MNDRPHDVGASADVLSAFWQLSGLTAEQTDWARFSARRFPSIVSFWGSDGSLEGRRILDLGGGIGSLAVLMRSQLGGRYSLADRIEWTPTQREALRRFGVETALPVNLAVPGTLASLPTDFDVVMFVEVLEHLLVNPLLLFREIYDHLTPEGRLFLTTPNQARLGNRLRLLRGRSIKERGRFPTDGTGGYGHVMEYTTDELHLLLTSESFFRERGCVVQHAPSPAPSPVQRLGMRLLNWKPAQRWALGDDLMLLYRKAPRPPPGKPRP
ncbi:MAG: methyltransferase domain-containing protein, partial [Thermoplasmata archaeon]